MVIFDTIVIEPFSGVYGYTKDAINILSTGNIIINTHTMVKNRTNNEFLLVLLLFSIIV